MERLISILTKARIIPDLVDLLPPGDQCYLVGGALRDWVLGRRTEDFDIATPFIPDALARGFAAKIGGKWFFLDEERRQSRIVVKAVQGKVTYDFAPFRGPDLEADLRRRDFTINAMALPLFGTSIPPDLLDPLRGRDDLTQALVRACAETTFDDDPSRIVKGVRHAVTLGFRIEDLTARRMRGKASLLSRVAPERIRNELAAILGAFPVSPALALLQGLRLIPGLFGPVSPAGSCEMGIRLAGETEDWTRWLEDFDKGGTIRKLLDEELEDGFTRRALMKMAGFLRGYAPEDLGAVLQDRLRLSRLNGVRIANLVGLRPGRVAELAKLDCPSRGWAVWTESLGSSPVDSLFFLGGLDKMAKEIGERFLKALREFGQHARAGRVPDLVDGNWIRDHLHLEESPAIGRILRVLRREEIAGRVKTPEDARKFVLSAGKMMIEKEMG